MIMVQIYKQILKLQNNLITFSCKRLRKSAF